MIQRKCPRCGEMIDLNSNFCPFCGFDTQMYDKQMMQETERRQKGGGGGGLAVTSLVLAIFSLFNNSYSWFSILFGIGIDFIINILTGVLGLIFAFAAKARGNSSKIQTAGAICSLLATIFAVFDIFYIWVIWPVIY